MKNTLFAGSIVAAALALLLSANTFFQIRSQACQRAFDRCVESCDRVRDRKLGENQLRRTQINFQLQRDLLACRIENIGNPTAIDQCQREKMAAAEQQIAAVDASDERVRIDRKTCGLACVDEAKRCDSRAPHLELGGGGAGIVDVPIEIDCLEGGAPCFHEVLDICTRISGPCDECWTSLCGGGDWEFESDVPLEVTLIAASDPSKDARVLSASSAKGTRAVLSVPNAIKLGANERLYFAFASKAKPGQPLKVFVHRSS